MNYIEAEAVDDPDAPQRRKLIIFADGTGNAFSTQESNVWRLYRALDRSRPDQKAIYIQGVGTSGNAIIAKLDGATGFGVPSNVRKLYSFLCWNWRPGDEIYMFGFSRGSFTIRCLAGLVASQGLMPSHFDGRPTTTAELKSNAMGAWRAYRSDTAPFRWGDFFESVKTLSPTVALVRHVRDLAIFGWRRLLRKPTHTEVLATIRERQPERAPGQVSIRFMGLFDTVEAYGLPVEEFRSVVNWAIWPISFRNRICSPIVKTIRHALSLDDERTTFHPIRFDQSKDGTVADAALPRTREVWFAGMHSDVGGGYADDSLALVPFSWMVDEAIHADLRFDLEEIARLKRQASPLSSIHDSRKGFASFYRYDPRRITSDPAQDGGPPIIHHSVAQKIVFGTGGYAPIGLPPQVNALAANGAIQSIAGSDTKPVKSTASSFTRTPDQEAIHVLQLHPPRKDLMERVSIFVVWRRITYALLVLVTVAIALMPMVGPLFEGQFHSIHQAKVAANVNAGVDSFVDFAGTWASMVLPGFVTPWIDALRTYSLSMIICLSLWLAFFVMNMQLHDRIRDYAYEAWVSHEGSSSPLSPLARALMAVGRQLAAPAWRITHRIVSHYLAPTAFSLALTLALGVVLSRGTFGVLERAGYICQPVVEGERQKLPRALQPGEARVLNDFSPGDLCQDMRTTLLKGQAYTLWIDPPEPFVDQTTVSEPGGYTSESALMFIMGKTLRRLTNADWFQPVGQIGYGADAVFPLEAADGQHPSPAAPWKALNSISATWESLETAEKQAFQKHRDDIVKQQMLMAKRTFVTHFIAPTDGPFYLYVNDLVPSLPLFGTIDLFYLNNTGKARVTIKRDPLPAAALERGEGR